MLLAPFDGGFSAGATITSAEDVGANMDRDFKEKDKRKRQRQKKNRSAGREKRKEEPKVTSEVRRFKPSSEKILLSSISEETGKYDDLARVFSRGVNKNVEYKYT